jgi:hypothetical protein
MRLSLALSALVLLGLFAAPSSVEAAGVFLTGGCNQLGATQMADDHTAILLCAFSSPNGATSCGSPSACTWRPMSSSEGPQGSFCGLLRCRVSVCYGDTSAAYVCTWAGVAEHVPCNGYSLVTAGTCAGEFTMNSSVPITAGGYFYTTTPVSCPAGYTRKTFSALTLPLIDPSLDTVYQTCVKN